MDNYKVTLSFIEPLLGAVSKDKNVYASHILTRAALTDEQAAEELASVEHVEEKGWTGFHTNESGPFLYNYVIKGFFKDACGMLRRVPGTRSSKLSAFKKVIDGLVFIKPRQIPLIVNGELGVLERPLRAQTAQGDRVTVARSDTAPVGSSITFKVGVLGVVTPGLLVEWLDYGQLRGLGQWRNGEYGAFEYTLDLSDAE